MPQFFCLGVKYKSKCKQTIKNPCSLFTLPFALSKLSMGTFWNFLGAIFFFKLRFTPCMAEQPLRGMELQGKDAQKD